MNAMNYQNAGRLFVLLLLWMVAGSGFAAPTPTPNPTPNPAALTLIPAAPELAASAYILLDARSGKVLVEHNADERLPPASLTKMMTGYLLSHEWEKGNVKRTDKAIITPNSWAQNPVFGGSSLMWVEVGTEVSLEDLYHGLVVSSGNDASVAIAEHLAGSEEAFADMMNQYAKTLGMDNSHFMNSHGLPHPDHYTTARDMALLAKAIITGHPDDYSVYKEQEFTYNGITQGNRNELLGEDGVDGLKTGHTVDAGYCLVASAEREGMRLISVVMGTKTKQARKDESRKLLTYGFRFFETRKLLSKDTVTHEARVWGGKTKKLNLGPGKDIYLTVARGKAQELQDLTVVDQVIKAPIEQGQELGMIVMKFNDKTVLEQPLVALESVPQAGFLARIWDSIVLFFQQFFSFG